jgi:hypothetical protein
VALSEDVIVVAMTLAVGAVVSSKISVPQSVSVPVPGTCIRVIPKLRLLVFVLMEKVFDSP